MQAASSMPDVALTWSSLDLPALCRELNSYLEQIQKPIPLPGYESYFADVRRILNSFLGDTAESNEAQEKNAEELSDDAQAKLSFCGKIESTVAGLRQAMATGTSLIDCPDYKTLLTMQDALNKLLWIEGEISRVFGTAGGEEGKKIIGEFRKVVCAAWNFGEDAQWITYIYHSLVFLINNELLLGSNLIEAESVNTALIQQLVRIAVADASDFEQVAKHEDFLRQLATIFQLNQEINQYIEHLEDSRTFAFNIDLSIKISALKQGYINAMTSAILTSGEAVVDTIQNCYKQLQALNRVLIDAYATNDSTGLSELYSEKVKDRPQDFLMADRAVLKLTRHVNQLQTQAHFVQDNPNQKNKIQSLATATENLKINLQQRLTEVDRSTAPLTESTPYEQLQRTNILLEVIQSSDRSLEKKQEYLDAYKNLYGPKHSRFEKVTGVFISAVAGFIAGAAAGAMLGAGAGGLLGAFVGGIGAIPGGLGGAAVGAVIGGVGGAATAATVAYKCFNHKREEQKLALAFVKAVGKTPYMTSPFSESTSEDPRLTAGGASVNQDDNRQVEDEYEDLVMEAS